MLIFVLLYNTETQFISYKNMTSVSETINCTINTSNAAPSVTKTNKVVGHSAVEKLTTCVGDYCIGTCAGSSIKTGSNNIISREGAAVGFVGTQTVCIGSAAKCGSTGSSNVVIGATAGTSLTSGGSNIFIGTSAGSTIVNTSGNILIGSAGVVGDSLTIRIGSNHNNTYIAGVSGSNISDGAAVMVTTSGKLGIITSSQRYKKNISKLDHTTITSIDKMTPVSFHYRDETDNSPLSYGMIAEEMADIDANMVIYGQDGLPQTIKYHMLVPILIAAVRELRLEVAALNSRLSTL